MSLWKKGPNLHTLSRAGRLKKIEELFGNDNFEHQQELICLKAQITERKGPFGFTGLHEAIAGDSLETLKYLFTHVDQSKVNIKADGRFSLLHLAASNGSVRIAKYLVENGAQVDAEDEYGKTPKRTAELSSKKRVVNYFNGIDIITQAELNSQGLSELLQNIETEHLEVGVLDKALTYATKNDNPLHIGMLVLRGAQNIEECLQIAEDDKRDKAYSSLFLILAAMKGSCDILTEIHEDPSRDNNMLATVRQCICDNSVSTAVPIEIAHTKGYIEVKNLLLLFTDVNEVEGCVSWNGLRISLLDRSLLEKIQWVRHFILTNNGLQALPDEVGIYLCKVVKLELQYNNLETIPKSLFSLPCLEELNLSHNKLKHLPENTEWSCTLRELDVSHNYIKTFSDAKPVPYNNMQVLNLGYNQLNALPQCICLFKSLEVLYLSQNRGICSLPTNMACLSKLRELHLDGLNNLESPPKEIHGDVSKVVAYLHEKLESS